MFRAIFQSSSFTKSVAVAAAAVGLSVGVAEPLVAQTVLEITGERLPYFRRHGDFLDIAGVDSTIHPVVRTYDLAQVGQPLTNTASPYAANEFERGRVSVTNFSPSGSYLGVHGLGLEGAEEFTRFTSVVAAPNYDNPMVLPGIENLPTEARQATMVTDNGGAVGSLNGMDAAIWQNGESGPTILGVGNVTDAPADFSVAVGISNGEAVGSSAFRPVIWFDPLGENRMEVLDVGPLDAINSAAINLISQDTQVMIAQRPTPSGGQFPTFVSMLLIKETDGPATSAADYTLKAIIDPDTNLLAGRPVALLDEGLPVSFYNATQSDEMYVVNHENIPGAQVTAQRLTDWLAGITTVPAAVAQADELLEVRWTGYDRLGMTFARGDDTVFFEFDAQATDTLGDVNADGVLDAADIDTLTASLNSSYGSQFFDLNFDGQVDSVDRDILITDRLSSLPGDSNLNGQFTTSDLVVAFQGGKYENPEAGIASWTNGDWNGDQLFNSSDLVAAFMTGAFDANAASPSAVPEPNEVASLAIALASFVALRRRR